MADRGTKIFTFKSIRRETCLRWWWWRENDAPSESHSEREDFHDELSCVLSGGELEDGSINFDVRRWRRRVERRRGGTDGCETTLMTLMFRRHFAHLLLRWLRSQDCSFKWNPMINRHCCWIIGIYLWVTHGELMENSRGVDLSYQFKQLLDNLSNPY